MHNTAVKIAAVFFVRRVLKLCASHSFIKFTPSVTLRVPAPSSEGAKKSY